MKINLYSKSCSDNVEGENQMNVHKGSSRVSIIPLFFLSLFFPIPLFSSEEQPYPTCEGTFNCGNLTGIGYPFRSISEPPNCRHPNLTLICENEIAKIEINKVKYIVLDINTQAHTVKLEREDLINSSCPQNLVSTTLENTIFEFNSNYTNLTFFYGGCDRLDSVFPGFFTLDFCHVAGYNTVNLLVGEKIPVNCKNPVIVPVTVLAAEWDSMARLAVLRETLARGFEVKWTVDDGACEDCTGPTASPGPVSSSTSTKKSGNSRARIVIMVVTSVVPIILIIIGFIIINKWKRNKEEKQRREIDLQELITSDDSLVRSDDKNDEEEGLELNILSFASIVEATNNFSNENKLGKGGFGTVYKGKLRDEQKIAVKRLSKMSGQGLAELKNELILIAKLQHTHLVRVLGCCLHEEEKMLIYEYMPNKSLDLYLFDPAKKELLNWPIRMGIIEGVAQGLLYLHKYSRMRVIHRDLKASNVLLDENMNPKISDFGMARIFKQNETEAVTNKVVGTYGYMSPEYAMEGTFSVKSDVFSFGVLILKIVSGRRNSSFYDFGERKLNLIGYAWELWKEGAALELKDLTIGGKCAINEFLKIVHVGLLCVQEDATDRPTMSDVIPMLTDKTRAFPNPKKPAFFTGRNLLDSSTYRKNSSKDCSDNLLSITQIRGR